MPEWDKCSHDPIPEKAIRISEAFERVLEALAGNSEPLEMMSSELKDFMVKTKQLDESRDQARQKSHASLAALHRIKEAVVFFRSGLRSGHLITYVRDPEDGAVLQLDDADWACAGGRLLLLEPPYAFEDDFLDDAPFSGNPKTFIRGAYRPVFLWRKDFEIWLDKKFGSMRPKGRPRGSGSYEKADMPYLDKMCNLLKTGEAKSINFAAVQVAKEAPRNNADEQSIITRLAKRFRKLFYRNELGLWVRIEIGCVQKLSE